MARRFISNYLSEYFLNLNTKTLSLSFWSGYLNCENLKLNPQKFNENKNLPIHLKDGFISKINMSLPIKSFFLGINNDIEITIEDIEINLITNSEFEFFDYTNFDYKYSYIKEITDDLLFKMELSKNPNFNDTYLTRSINYFLRNMKIEVKNAHIKLIHGTNDLYNAVFCANIDYINLKKDSFIIDKFYIYTENIVNANHNIRKKGHDYILLPLTIKSEISLMKQNENDINIKENINVENNNENLNNNNIKEIETYFVSFEIDEINFSIHKEQFILIMNLINFFIDYANFYNNCFILRKIQYKKPKKEYNINSNSEINNENKEKKKDGNYYYLLLKHYIKGLILIFKEKKFNIDVFDYYKDLNSERKKIFQNKFIEFFFKNKKDDEMIEIIRFTDEDILKKWIEEMCDNIYKYQQESAQGFFSGIKSFFFKNAFEGMEISNLEEVSSRQKIICEFKGNINIITLSLKNYNEEIKLRILENELDFFRGRIYKILETRIGKIKLSFKHLINKSFFTKEIILPLVNDNENKEIYIKYIFKKFIPKSVNEKSNLIIKCTSHVFIYNHRMFHSLYQFLYKDVTFMNKNFTHYKLFLRISSHKFDKENKVNLNINVANHKVIIPYLNFDYLNYYNDEKLEINFGDLDVKSSEQYDILVENISVDFIDKNLITHPIIKNFNLILKSSFDLNINNLQLKSIEIQTSINLLQTILFKTKNISESSKPENIWKIKNKNKKHIYNNAIKKGYLYYVRDNVGSKYYAVISGGYIYLFKNYENSVPDYLIPLYDSFLEEKYYSNKIFGFNIIFCGKNSNGNQYNNIYEFNFNTKNEMNEWKSSIDFRIEEINKSLINIQIKHKRKLSDPNLNNNSNTNIILNEEKEIDKNINMKKGSNYSQLILEESKRIRDNIINKYENNQQKKLRIYLDQILKFVNSSKGNRHFTIEIENISLLLKYPENAKDININYDKGCEIVLNNTKIEYMENNIFFIIQSYFGNIKVIRNNINLIQVNDNVDEDVDINSFINCNLLVCYDSSYLLLDNNRDKLLKLIPNIKKKEEIEEFILKVKTNQIKLNIFKEVDISFESEEIFMNIKLIKDFFKKIKRKFDESIQIKNKINLNINSEKNITLVHYDELNKNKYYLVIKKISSKENKTILKDVYLMNKGTKNKNNKIIVKEFDIIIKDYLINQKIMYDIEFTSDIFCYLDKIDYDNIYNIISDIRYTFKNNFSMNINKDQLNSVKNNNFLRLFKFKIKKIEINFIISSIFRTKDYNEIKIIMNNIIISKEKPNNYIYVIDDIILVKNMKNNNGKIKYLDKEAEVLVKIPKSSNAIFIQYENIKKEKRKILDLVIDKIICNFQYELLYDFLNFFINIKYNSYYYQNKNSKDVSNNLETNSNIPINSSFSNNTIISINNTMNKDNYNESKNIELFQKIKENKPISFTDNSPDIKLNQITQSLTVNFNVNSFLIKIPVKIQKNNIIIQSELNEYINGFHFDEEEEEIDERDNQSQYFCFEFISLLFKFNTDLVENDKSLPCKKYLKLHSPENKIYMINKESKEMEETINLISNSFSFFTEIEYNYNIHKEMFIPQKKYNIYFYIPDNINININFDQLKSLLNILIDIKNYYQESKLTYFTYCYLSEPEIYTSLKTLFFEICGHIKQKLIIRIEEFFEIIMKNVNLSFNDISQESNNQDINISFSLIIKYYNRNIKDYELFLEKYYFKFTALNNYFKFGSDDKSFIDCSSDEENIDNNFNDKELNLEKNEINLSKSINNKNLNEQNEKTFEKSNNPNGLSLNITVELLYIINNIYDIFMLYKKCHVLQNIKNQNVSNTKNNDKTFLIYIYNFTTENMKINKIYEIKKGESIKYKLNQDNERLFEIVFNKSNIQFNDIKLNQLQHIIIYNKIYFCCDNKNKYYFFNPIIFKSFCQKEIIISNFSNDESIFLNSNKIQGLDINEFKNKTIHIKINENMITSINQHLIEKIKNFLINNEKNGETTKILIRDYLIFKCEFIYKTKEVIKIEIYPRYLILNTLNIPIIFYGILNKYPEVNKKIIETELNIDGKITDIYYPDLPQLMFKLKIIDNEVKNGNNEFLSEIATLNNDDIDDSIYDFGKNQINEINKQININTNHIFNTNNVSYMENKKTKIINGKLKVRFKVSEDLNIKIIYHTIPETKQIKIYLYMDYFILNNTKLNIYPLNNCISFNDKNFMVNYYPLKNFKNFQLVVADKVIEKFEIKKEDYAFFTHIEVEIMKDKKINLLIQRHLRYFKLGEKLYKIDFLIISQIQKTNIDNNNNINNIVVNSNIINKIKNFSNENQNEKNNIFNDDDILMKLVKQRNFIDIPEVNDIEHKFSFQLYFPSIFIILIANNKNENSNYKNEFEFGSRYEIASINFDNVDFNFTKERINFKKENSRIIEDDTISNININNIQNNMNKNNYVSDNFELNNNSKYLLEEIEDIYNNNIELTIQSIQIDNLLQNVIYKIIFYNKKENKKLLSSFNDSSYNKNYFAWLGMPLLLEKSKSNSNNKEDSNNNMNNNKILPFIHFKGSFINQDYKYYFKDINICFLPCYLYLDSEFSSELLIFISESYNVFKNKNLYYSQSIKEIIESLSFNLDSNFNSKFFMFISSFKVSPLTIFFNYKNFSNRFFNLLNLQNNFINTLLEVFTNNTTSIKFQFNSIVLYDINVRFNALLYKLYDYYYYTFLRECIKIIFSVDLLGDPYHLISHLSQGISNFITLPILSIFNGPSDFIFYLLYGTKSLLSNSIGGLLDSLHKFTNSISKNILKLTNSEEYIKSRNKIMIKENYIDENLINYLENNKKKRNYNTNLKGFNFKLISKILFNGIKYGITDLIVIPYKYYLNNGIIELPIGTILGTISLIVKPVSATMDSISILSNSISQEILKGENNYDIDEDYMYYSYNRKRQRREWIYDNKKIRSYKEENIDILLKLIGDCFNIDNEIERGIINGNYFIDKLFITKYNIKKGEINKHRKSFNNQEKRIIEINNIENKLDKNEIAKNNLIISFMVIASIKNIKNNEFSMMIYKINLNKHKNERKFELFKNKTKIEDEFKISMNLENIIPLKDIISINYNKNEDSITFLFESERKKDTIDKTKIFPLLKFNHFSAFYRFYYYTKEKDYINIKFSSKYILNEFLDYYSKIKYIKSK